VSILPSGHDDTEERIGKASGPSGIGLSRSSANRNSPAGTGRSRSVALRAREGKFWEYHDLLFADQAGLEKNGLLSKAQMLKLDQKQFDACLSGGKYKAQVEQDAQDGRRVGLSGTPGFFINGVFLSGAQPESAFETLIKDELAAAARP